MCVFGTEVMSIAPSLFQKLERCQSWFLKNVFFVPAYAPSIVLLKISGLNSIESEVHVKWLLLLGRIITEPKIAPAVKTLCASRVNSYFNPDINSVGFFVYINESLCKYNPNTYFEHWHANSVFPSYNEWENIGYKKISEYENNNWHIYCENHPLVNLANSCFSNISPSQFWAIFEPYPDSVKHSQQ